MKKPRPSQTPSYAFQIGRDAVLNMALAEQTNEVSQATGAIMRPKGDVTIPALRLLQKRLRRERRHA